MNVLITVIDNWQARNDISATMAEVAELEQEITSLAAAAVAKIEAALFENADGCLNDFQPWLDLKKALCVAV